MAERGMGGVRGGCKTGYSKEGWENADFPILCETCLGDNPYVRMMKEKYGKSCKICERPFTVFRWRPGTGARYKKTEICQTCAKMKNVCQTCVFDLNYGLPVQVRDQFLQEGGHEIMAVPESDVNREWFSSIHNQQVESGNLPYGKMANSRLLQLARKTPYYKRNRPHICSFFVKGECTRGASCPYRHEMPTNKDDPMAQQNIKDRFYGVDDPVAQKIMKRDSEAPKPEEPEDSTVSTLWVGGMTPSIGEKDLRDAFYSYGEVRTVHVVARQRCAFVEFTTRESAKAAADAMYNRLVVKGVKLALNWSKERRHGDGSGQAVGAGEGAQPGNRHAHAAAQSVAVAGLQPGMRLSAIPSAFQPAAYAQALLAPPAAAAAPAPAPAKPAATEATKAAGATAPAAAKVNAPPPPARPTSVAPPVMQQQAWRPPFHGRGPPPRGMMPPPHMYPQHLMPPRGFMPPRGMPPHMAGPRGMRAPPPPPRYPSMNPQAMGANKF